MLALVLGLFTLLAADIKISEATLSPSPKVKCILSEDASCSKQFELTETADAARFKVGPAYSADEQNSVVRCSYNLTNTVLNKKVNIYFSASIDNGTTEGSHLHFVLFNEEFTPAEFNESTPYFVKFGPSWDANSTEVEVYIRQVCPKTGNAIVRRFHAPINANIRDSFSHKFHLFLNSRVMAIRVDASLVSAVKLNLSDPTQWTVVSGAECPANETEVAPETEVAEQTEAPVENNATVENNVTIDANATVEANATIDANATVESTNATETPAEEKPKKKCCKKCCKKCSGLCLSNINMTGVGVEIAHGEDTVKFNTEWNVYDNWWEGLQSFRAFYHRSLAEKRLDKYQKDLKFQEEMAALDQQIKAAEEKTKNIQELLASDVLNTTTVIAKLGAEMAQKLEEFVNASLLAESAPADNATVNTPETNANETNATETNATETNATETNVTETTSSASPNVTEKYIEAGKAILSKTEEELNALKKKFEKSQLKEQKMIEKKLKRDRCVRIFYHYVIENYTTTEKVLIVLVLLTICCIVGTSVCIIIKTVKKEAPAKEEGKEEGEEKKCKKCKFTCKLNCCCASVKECAKKSYAKCKTCCESLVTRIRNLFKKKEATHEPTPAPSTASPARSTRSTPLPPSSARVSSARPPSSLPPTARVASPFVSASLNPDAHGIQASPVPEAKARARGRTSKRN